MIQQFDTLNRCLQELGSCTTSSIGKLKVELQLMLTKRVLLDCAVELRAAGDARSEREFLDLYDQVRLVCSSHFAEPVTDNLIARLEQVRADLEIDRAPSGTCNSPARKVGRRILSVLAGRSLHNWKAHF